MTNKPLNKKHAIGSEVWVIVPFSNEIYKGQITDIFLTSGQEEGEEKISMYVYDVATPNGPLKDYTTPNIYETFESAESMAKNLREEKEKRRLARKIAEETKKMTLCLKFMKWWRSI